MILQSKYRKKKNFEDHIYYQTYITIQNYFGFRPQNHFLRRKYMDKCIKCGLPGHYQGIAPRSAAFFLAFSTSSSNCFSRASKFENVSL